MKYVHAAMVPIVQYVRILLKYYMALLFTICTVYSVHVSLALCIRRLKLTFDSGFISNACFRYSSACPCIPLFIKCSACCWYISSLGSAANPPRSPAPPPPPAAAAAAFSTLSPVFSMIRLRSVSPMRTEMLR